MTAPDAVPEPDRREDERRLLLDRRSGVDRRQKRGAPPATERRGGPDRRGSGERRAYLERRMSLQSAGDQIRGALKQLTTAIESGAIPDKQRRGLDAAMLRLRFALERLED
jgi:hypothetical protein